MVIYRWPTLFNLLIYFFSVFFPVINTSVNKVFVVVVVVVDEELENLYLEDRCRLIQNDPVTCARHFDFQVNQFLTNFLLSSVEPLGKISDWF